MNKTEALNEVCKMWTWLYKHPAHDREYYVTHVAKLDQPWKNYCALGVLEDGKCPECLMEYEDRNGTFCTDPESPLQKWKETPTDNPDVRTMYSGQIIEIAQKATGKLTAAH